METRLYKEVPENFDPELVVAGYFLHVGDEFLLVLRSQDKMGGGLWGNPGGKVDAGETILQAASRESLEETGVDVPPEKFKHVITLHGVYEGTEFTYHMCGTWLDEKPQIILDMREHSAYEWVTLEQALKKQLVKTHDQCLKAYFSALHKL